MLLVQLLHMHEAAALILAASSNHATCSGTDSGWIIGHPPSSVRAGLLLELHEKVQGFTTLFLTSQVCERKLEVTVASCGAKPAGDE